MPTHEHSLCTKQTTRDGAAVNKSGKETVVEFVVVVFFNNFSSTLEDLLTAYAWSQVRSRSW